jgi:hypothetical protein
VYYASYSESVAAISGRLGSQSFTLEEIILVWQRGPGPAK